jgi:hypothetical protein
MTEEEPAMSGAWLRLAMLALAVLLAPAIFSGARAQDQHAGRDAHANHDHSAMPGSQGRHGVGHERWHEQFYAKLKRKDNKTSCCNLTDCVPTQSRMIDDHYEVLVEGEWTRVSPDVIQNVMAPDGGAHVCFPKPSVWYPKGTLFCVVLPPET